MGIVQLSLKNLTQVVVFCSEKQLFPFCFPAQNKALKFKKFSLLGWSDGGITALIAAARYPNLIHKMVVWGANSSVKEEDVKLYNGVYMKNEECLSKLSLVLFSKEP